ncbi:MAG: magnesium transporter [Tissierellia bacterium]|nr:magnesium transporter [Tissierellia bacterium]
MEEQNIEQLRLLVEQKKLRELKQELLSYNEADIAIFIESLNDVEALAVFRILPKEEATETFSFFELDTQERFINIMTNAELTNLAENLYIDDVVDMLEELPATVVKKILKDVQPQRRAIINQYMAYPEDSAGSIMTAEYIGLKEHITVKQALDTIRVRGLDSENIYTCYITDNQRKLEGFVSVRTLLVNNDDVVISDLLEEDVIYVTTTDDQEDVARLFAKYGFLSLPVVDHEKRLVGVVTIDDAVDVLEEEATEDIELMAAMTPSEKPYLKTSVLELAKNRFTWLIILMLTATVTGFIINSFEATLTAVAGAMAFVPMLTGAGGNAGAQSSTMVIRGLSIGELELDDYKKIFIKELGVSILVGVVLAIVNFFRIIIFNPGQYLMALTVSLSLVVTIMIAKSVGGLLPIAAKRLNLDPAIMASPLITTIVDTLSLLVYFFFITKIML